MKFVGFNDEKMGKFRLVDGESKLDISHEIEWVNTELSNE
jgi:hypothetical protein